MNKKDALLIIDMQNVYLPPNQWKCVNMQNTINYIKNKINEFSKENIFITEFIAPKNPKGTWIEYNKKFSEINSSEYLNDYVKELKEFITKDNLFVKSTFSSLKNKELYNRLNEFDRVYVTGVVAECCVLSTIFELIDMGKKVIYCKAGIAGISNELEKEVIDVLQGLSPLHIVFE